MRSFCAILLLISFLGSGRSLKETEEPTTTSCVLYTEIEHWNHFVARSCPINFDPMCDDPIFDPMNLFDYRCTTFPKIEELENQEDNQVVLMNASRLQDLVKIRDKYYRHWCMVTMFFSHGCIFSAKLAPHFNVLPIIFPNLVVIGVNVSEITKLNFRYGISGTPTVLFWVSGNTIARMDGPLDLETLVYFVKERTDLKERADWMQVLREKMAQINGTDYTNFTYRDIANDNGALEHLGVLIDMSDKFWNTLLMNIFSLLSVIMCAVYYCRGQIMHSEGVRTYIIKKFGEQYYQTLLGYLYLDPPGVQEVHQEREQRGPAPGPEIVEPQNDEVIEEIDVDAIEEDAARVTESATENVAPSDEERIVEIPGDKIPEKAAGPTAEDVALISEGRLAEIPGDKTPEKMSEPTAEDVEPGSEERPAEIPGDSDHAEEIEATTDDVVPSNDKAAAVDVLSNSSPAASNE